MKQKNNKEYVSSTTYLQKLEDHLKQDAQVILSEMSITSDYYGGNLNFILVEGKTDESFFKREKFKKSYDNNNYYLSVKKITNFLKGEENKRANNKNLILELVKVSIFSQMFSKNKLYGIIDRDFENEYPNNLQRNVLSNNTHDLETLILNTDKDVIKKLYIKNLDNETYLKALYMAYQVGLVKFAIWQNDKMLSYNLNHNFAVYFNNENLDIQQYVNYLTKNSSYKVTLSYGNLIKQMKELLDSENNFKLSLKDFTNNLPEDVWYIVNGHDFCDAVDYLLGSINDLENLLVNNYNMDMFKNSELYKKMLKLNLVT